MTTSTIHLTPDNLKYFQFYFSAANGVEAQTAKELCEWLAEHPKESQEAIAKYIDEGKR